LLGLFSLFICNISCAVAQKQYKMAYSVINAIITFHALPNGPDRFTILITPDTDFEALITAIAQRVGPENAVGQTPFQMSIYGKS
jgi:hypothetical protein